MTTMTTITATEARNNIGKLWSQAAGEPVTVVSAGQHGVKAGSAKHLFEGVDVDALLATNIDEVFEGLNPLAGGADALNPRVRVKI